VNKKHLFGTMKTLFTKFTFIAFLFAFAIQSNAQVTAPLWDNAFGTCGGWYQNGGGVRVGVDGNAYLAYRYSGTVNLGIPGFTVSPANGGGGTSIGNGKLSNILHGNWGTEIQSSGGDDYIMGNSVDPDLNSYAGGIISSGAGWYCGKTDVNGVLQWNIQCFGAGGYASGICTDKNVIPTAKGHTYICGPYNGATMNVLGHSIPSQGVADGFILRVNSQGQIDPNCWLIALHGPVGGASYPSRCAMDYAGHLWVCGGYSGSPTFGSITLPASSGSSNYNLFVAEIDTANGSVLNVYTAANAGSSSPWAPSATSLGDIVIDSCNNIYVSGPFMGTATWGTFSATCAGGGPNYYLAKIQSNGKFQWVATNSSPNSEGNGYFVTIDKNWDILTTGQFSSTATFGSQTITGSSSGSICVAKYASGNGALMYALQAGGNSGSQGGAGIATDANRQVYVSGTYNSPGPTFNTISGPLTLPTGVSSSIYLARLDSTPNLRIIPNPQSDYCAGQCYTLPVSAVGTFNPGNTFTAQLSDANGSFATGVTNVGTVTATASGNINICIPANQASGTNYLLRVASSNPEYCSIVHCNTITIHAEPTVTLSTPPSLCMGSSTTLTASGGTSYSWSNGATTSNITVSPNANITYTLGVTSNGCTKDTNIEVKVNPLPTVTVTAPTICGGSTGTITANVNGGSAPYSYVWSAGLTSTTSSGTVSISSSQTFTVNITDANGCGTTGQGTVNVYANPTASFVASPQIASILSPTIHFTNTSTGSIGSWFWTFGDSASLLQNPVHTYQDTGTFCAHLVVKDLHGCVDSVTNCIEITPQFAFFVPSAFTPNGDGLNDVFQPAGKCVKTFEMYIFDRWGSQIYYSNNINNGWTGAVGSRIAEQDTYVYEINVTDVENKPHSYTGRLTLLK
jgi:gliding motility-associated-like protein